MIPYLKLLISLIHKLLIILSSHAKNNVNYCNILTYKITMVRQLLLYQHYHAMYNYLLSTILKF